MHRNVTEPKMAIDPPFLSALSALVGALAGGSASLAAATYTQRNQDRLQRVARETTKREAGYANFTMSASTLRLNADLQDGFTPDAEGKHLAGLANRMWLFAP